MVAAPESVITTALPDHDIASIDSTGPSWNELNETVRVETASEQTLFVKYATDGDGTRIRREAGVIRFLDDSPITVPDPYTVDSDATTPYLVTEKMPGRPLIAADQDADRETRRRYLRAIGRTLAEVHQHRFDSHARIVDGDTAGLELERCPWPDLLASRVEFMRALGPSDHFDHYFDAVLDRIAEHTDRLSDAPATLVHGDPAKPNCRLIGDDIGLLDWEIAHVGDPARELRRAHRQLLGGFRQDVPDDVVEVLHDGYCDVAGNLPEGFHDREPIYAAVTFLGICGFFEKYVEYRDESESELESWVEATMEARLERIDDR